MSLVANPAIVERFKQHRSFCLSRGMRKDYRAILAFDIETRQIFFNTQSFLLDAAYERRWHEVELETLHLEVSEAADRVAREATKLSAHSHRFHPYHRDNKGSDELAGSSGGNFRKGKCVYESDVCLYFFCSRTGHRVSRCTHIQSKMMRSSASGATRLSTNQLSRSFAYHSISESALTGNTNTSTCALSVAASSITPVRNGVIKLVNIIIRFSVC
ncbi:uncharacterized protein EDB91DRAFT_134832 [Suillus paluster]|uniref:uncharacterized protein n=1 Tax=Suillus paluster TaxID=48578 RepID=UPI001B860300|nr:uncharacterized protein EDB91DRAFT_134832 [Suillus paluster]KAG1745962.1 hypothetical protein EDB91DRAFT_134832 [Suillus paluster]